MNTKVDIEISAPKEKVWDVITAIENAVHTISGIEKVEVLVKPKDTVVGLKWKETRTVFGKSATETMWITEAEEYSYYKTRAESNGAIYQTILKLTEKEEGCQLEMEFSSEAITFKAKIMAFIFGGVLRKSMKKLVYQDLVDIKAYAENN